MLWRKKLFFLFLSWIRINNAEPIHHSNTRNEVQEQTVMEMIERIMGKEFKAQISVDGVRQNGGRDRAEVGYDGHVFRANASTGVAAAWAVNHFLKYSCTSQVSWEYIQVDVTRCKTTNFSLEAMDLYRYYENVCTPGYSFVWWNWQKWEKHIDWMALNGINMPLAFTGQEEIWRRVWIQFGLSQSEMDSYFSGPAFLPWNRMGNLRGFGGPLTASWHKHQLQLQRNILKRMRSFGMTPVLPAFSGQTPPGLARLFANSTFRPEATWNRFPPQYSGVLVLDSQDPLFLKIGKAFIDELTKEFGTDHLYNCDTYNEMRPPTSNPDFLASATSAVFSAMAAADPDAVWVMQGWLFLDEQFWREPQIRAVLTAVEQGRMIMLDLDSTDREQYTRTESYHGQPFIFNMIHTFGGQLAMFGRASNVNNRPKEARSMKNSTMVGTGFAPEGIHNSYIMYELLSEMSWRKEPIEDLPGWFRDYPTARYGTFNEAASQAWALLSKNVYNSSIRNFHGKVLISRMPDLNIKDIRWYNLSEILDSWKFMISAGEALKKQNTYQFDLVDITRQALVNLAPIWHNKVRIAYKEKNAQEIHKNAIIFIDLLKDLDKILATNENFLLGPWLESAKSLATTYSERLQYEFNARNQLTLWGPNGQILDYAGKHWSGLVSHYYMPRWKLFFKSLESAVITGASFDRNQFREEFLQKIGQPFCRSKDSFPLKPSGDALEISTTLYGKWKTAALDGCRHSRMMSCY